MADPALVISLAAEFVGKPAFKQADTATQKLSKNVSKLARNLGLAFGTTAILAYGKAAVRAAAADEKAQQQLALALTNVGLGRDAASSEAYIQDLQSEFGIVDDKLRPAYQTLAVATRSSAKAQQLLNLALDISASTGKDLGSVTGALSKAFLGNNAALSKLGVGISKADLKAAKFDDIVAQLSTTFAGSATAAANTFQGSLDKLGVASANVQEIIGTGLIDAIRSVGKEDGIENLAKSMESAALSAADFLRGLGQIGSFSVGKESKSILGLITTPFKRSFSAGPLGAITRIGETSRIGTGGGFAQGPPAQFQSGIDARAAKAAADADAKARKLAAAQAAKLATSQKATVKSQADALKLAKAKAVFDLAQIQIVAALKGKISAEDEIRLKLMKAIEEENLSQVEKYEQALAKAQEKTAELQKAVAAIGTTTLANPYEAYKTYAADAIALTNSVAQASIQAGLTAGVALAAALSGARLAAQGQAAESAAALAAAQSSLTALTDAQKTAKDAIAATLKAQQDGLTTQAKAQQDAIAATLKAQQDALTAQAKAQKDALTAENAANLAALQDRLDKEAALKKAANANAAAAALAIDGVAGTDSGTDTTDTTAAAAILAAAAAQEALARAAAETAAAAILAAAAAQEALARAAAETAAAIATATAAAAAQAAADAADLAGAGNTSVEITVNAGVIANADEVAILVQEAIQNLNRRGDPLFLAGIA